MYAFSSNLCRSCSTWALNSKSYSCKWTMSRCWSAILLNCKRLPCLSPFWSRSRVKYSIYLSKSNIFFWSFSWVRWSIAISVSWVCSFVSSLLLRSRSLLFSDISWFFVVTSCSIFSSCSSMIDCFELIKCWSLYYIRCSVSVIICWLNHAACSFIFLACSVARTLLVALSSWAYSASTYSFNFATC